MRRAGGASMAWLDRRLGSDFATGLRLGVALAPRVTSGRFRGRVVLAGMLFGSGRWRRPVKLQLDAPSGQIDFIVPDYAALKALGQVFVDRKYDVATEQDPRSILDLGAHIGVSVLFFRRRFPSARIVAIEASPSLIPILKRNTRELNVEVHHLAVARSEGTVYFEESKESWAGATVTQRPSAAAVPAVTLDSLLLDSVDLVKISIGGGAEFDILPACERLDQVSHVVVEAQAAPGTPRSIKLLESLDGFDVSSNQPGPLVRFTLFKARRPRRGGTRTQRRMGTGDGGTEPR